MHFPKTILITGASSGIGEACARAFASLGAKLILCARRREKLIALSEELNEKWQTKSFPLLGDVRNAELLFQKINELPEEFQSIDILINNAGLGLGKDLIMEGRIEDWNEMIDTNIKGLLQMTRVVLPGMIKRNEGHIINIGSIAGHAVYPGGAVYCATKYAVKALSQGMRLDLSGSPIRVSSVDPGAVETNFSVVRFKGDEQQAKAVYQDMQPLTPADIADAIVYCAMRPPHVNISEIIIMPTDQASVNVISRKK